ncbi:sorbosone dehydrogenase family protein, partial [Burkholderia pseudomallei]
MRSLVALFRHVSSGPPALPRAASAACLVLATIVTVATAPAASAALPIDELRVPPGFRVQVLADDVPTAREMAWSPRGILYVGSMNGRVHALVVRDGHVREHHV